MQLLAAARIHSYESAELQLRQLTCSLRSFIDELNHGESSCRSPAISLDRFPSQLKAANNPHPRPITLCDDAAPEVERFEHQFERWAQRTPDAIALDFRYGVASSSERTTLSYAELNRRACLVCDLLLTSVAELSDETVHDPIVALCLDKSPEMYVAQLGILKAHAAWCPIDPDWPETRKQALLEKAGASVVLTAGDEVSKSVEAILPGDMVQFRVDHLDWGQTPAHQPKLPIRQPPHAGTAAQLAYKIWTSGTTGLPKGVGIEHSAAVQALRSLQAAIPHDGPIKYLQFSAYVFDLSIMDCFYTWGLGGTICACPREVLLTNLAAIVNVFDATHTLLTPAVMAMTPREDCPSLKVVINGGEKLTQVVADMWSVDCCLLNLYGPAEATLIAMQRRVPSNDRVKAPNIGIALPTVSCHALDRKGQPVLKGCIGQLALGGFQCARGYIGDEQKTADKFISHPQLGRVYMTGDLVRQLADETFEYLGREDDQIKINGIRIETLEISAIIRSSHASVKDSETMALPITNEDDVRIINFSVLSHDESDTGEILRLDHAAADVARKLRSAAQKTLPSYMVPSLFIIVSRFPRTSSSKIDRVALKKVLSQVNIPEWEAAIAGNTASDGAEQQGNYSAQEEFIRGHVAALCFIEETNIGRHTPLPSLGLDSIKAMILARQLNQSGAVVSVIDIVRAPTIAALAKKISTSDESQNQRRNTARRQLKRLTNQLARPIAEHLGTTTSAIQAVWPTTPLQQGMLAETSRSSNQTAYWLNRIYKIDKSIAPLRGQQAFTDIFASTAGCRLAFVEASQFDETSQLPSYMQCTFLQVVRSDVEPPIRLFEEQLSHSEALAMACDLTGTNPLSGAPPFAVILFGGQDANKILLRAHHSIYDARTLELLGIRLSVLLESDTSTEIHDLDKALPHILPWSQAEYDGRRTCWTEALAGIAIGPPAPFPLLSGNRKSKQRLGVHKQVSLSIPKGWSKLSDAAKRLGTSARPIAQCAWAAVLSAYLDSPSILLGDSISGRAIAADLENVFGPLHATIAVPIQVDPGISRRQMVDAVDEFHKSVLTQQHMPLSFVRKQLGISADEPLFQSIFVFEASSSSAANPLLKHVEDLELSVEHPLAVEVLAIGDETLSLGLVYDDSVLEDEQANCLLEQFQASLRLFCDDLDDHAQAWNSIDERLLSITRNKSIGAIDDAAAMPVESWLRTHSRSQPDAVALEYWPSFSENVQPVTMTYSTLEQQATQLALSLVDSLPRQSVVAVCLPRCLETYVALLAVQLSGNAYLPIDEHLPRDRKQLLMNDSHAALLLTNRDMASSFSNTSGAPVMLVDDPELPQRINSSVASLPKPGSHDLSYILYTSGSTGKPKGCKLTRANLSVAIEAFRLRFEEELPGSFAHTARFLARSAEAFDVALLETFLPLRTGSTIVTAPREDILEDLGRALQRTEVTHAAVVPSLFYSSGKRILPQDAPCLRALIVGGEQIATDIIDAWGSSKVCTLNAYGPTEATIGISMSRVQPGIATSNLGQPFSGSRYVIMREHNGKLFPTLRGQAGELCIVGPQVGVGYLGDRDASAFQSWNGAALYRTGDSARLTMKDEAIYLGRMDDSQVKIRGARLELKEIDAVLSVPDQIQAATVLVRPTSTADPRLVSFIASEALLPVRAEALGLQLGVDEAQSHLVERLQEKVRRELPGHMQPSGIIALQYLPLAAVSGKIDLARLRACYEELLETLNSHDPGASSTPPRSLTSMEALVLEHFYAVVPHKDARPDVCHSTDLFSAGLDSLSAISLVGRLKRAGLQISILDLMSNATLQAAAALCQSGSKQKDARKAEDPALVALRAKAEQHGLNVDSFERILPCTPMQKALIAQTLASAEAPYLSRLSVRVRRSVDRARLTEAIDATFAARPIWRTCFYDLDGDFVQVVHPQSTPAPWVSTQDEMSNSRAVIDEIATRPPVRLYYQEEVTGDCVLYILAHHALYDGVSFQLCLDEIEKRYYGQTIAANATSFEDAALAMNAADRLQARQFWEQKLSHFSVTPFPGLHSERHTPSFVRHEATHVPTISSTELSAAARRLAVTSQSLMLGAFSSLFSQYVGEQDAVFGLVLGGRNSLIEDAEDIHGPLLTTVPFRTNWASQDVGAQTRWIHQSLLDIYHHQHTSLLDIQEWAGADHSLFDTLFSFLPSGSKPSPLFEGIDTQMDTELPLAIEVEPRHDDTLLFRVVYDPSLWTAEHAELFLQQLESELHRFVNIYPPAVIGQQDIPEHLYAISNPNPLYPQQEDHFISLFQHQVLAAPKAKAIDFAAGGLDAPFQQLTYSELDRLSSELAARLATRSQHPVTAVLMHRSLSFYISILAVWKSGKAYLPLDPSLPLDRLQYMLSCAQASFVVTDAECSEIAGHLSDQVLCVDRDESALLNGMADYSSDSRDLDSIAYILFTSGSTGKPKGVPVSHRALAAAIASWRTILPHTASSRMLQLASPSFDVSLIEICMPLAFGFTVASAPKDVLLEDLEETFRKLCLTMADLPAALATTVHPGNVPTLEWLMSGGDALDQRVLNEWSPHGLINAWGPTEATIGNTLGFVTAKSKRSLVGQAYPASSIYILRPATSELVLKGGIGEIVVGGPQIAEGYLGRGDEAKASFFRLPDGTPAYKTGDRGRLLANNDVEVLGRISRGQVKLRGQRLELDEINAAFRAHAEIEDADTLYVQHPSLPAKQLICWVSLRTTDTSPPLQGPCRTDEKAAQAAQRALAHVQKSLPSYMIPVHILVARDTLPLTPNNKIDHSALEAAFKTLDVDILRSFGQSMLADEREHPLTPREASIRRAVAKFSGASENEIGRSTSFHRLGIDSISALRLVKELREANIADVAVRDVMRWPNVALLAHNTSTKNIAVDEEPSTQEHIVRTVGLDLPSSAWKLNERDTLQYLLPCTPLQSGMLAQTEATGGQLYFLHHAFFVPEVTPERLIEVWRVVVSMRDILRSTFHRASSDGSWLQAMHTSLPVSTEIRRNMDVDKLWLSVVQDASPDVGQMLAKQPHRLFVCSCDGGTAAVLSLHHALYDGITIPLLWEDIASGLRGDKPAPRANFGSIAPLLLPEQVDTDFWVAKLNAFDQKPLSETASPSMTSLESHFRVSMLLTEARQKTRLLAVGLRTVALFAFLRVLASVKATRDVVTGEIVSLRDVGRGSEIALGPIFNTIATRLRLEGNVPVSDLLKQMQRESDEGRPHRRASLQDVQSSIGLLAAPFDSLFDYHIQEDADDAATGSSGIVSCSPQEEPIIQYGLNVEFIQSVDELEIHATASGQHFSQSEADKLVAAISQVFVTTLNNPLKSADEVAAAEWPLPEVNETRTTPGHLNGAAEWHQEKMLLSNIVAELFGVACSDSTVERPLSSLGVDSISVLRLASQARARGLPLAVSDLIQGRTISGAVGLMKARSGGQGTRSAPAAPLVSLSQEVKDAVARELHVGNEDIESVLPCLPGQVFQLTRWLKSGMRTGQFSWSFQSSSPIDHERLRSCWSTLCRRHTVLRTTFCAVDGNVYQSVMTHDQGETHSPIVWTRGESVLVQGRAMLGALASKPRDLKTPPVSLHVLETETSSLVVLNISHALYDAWSVDELLRELQQLYKGSPLPPPSDFNKVVAQLTTEHGEVSGETFWCKELQCAEPTILRRQTGQDQDVSQGVLVYEPTAFASVAAYQSMQRRSTKERLPPLQHLFAAAWAVELCALTGTDRPMFGLYHSGRASDVPEVQSAAGPTLNVLPIATPFSAVQVSLVELAIGFEEAAARQLPHVQTELAQICQWVGCKEKPLFDTYLNLIWKPSRRDDHDGGEQDDDAVARTTTAAAATATSWTQVKLGDPSDFAPREAIDVRTTIDGIAQRYLDCLSVALEVDVVLQPDQEHVGIGIHSASADVMDREGLVGVVRSMSKRVQVEVERLQSALECAKERE